MHEIISDPKFEGMTDQGLCTGLVPRLETHLFRTHFLLLLLKKYAIRLRGSPLTIFFLVLCIMIFV
jgi:hypothetical protein